MKKSLLFILVLVFTLVLTKTSFSQSEDLLYVCTKYVNGKEVGISDRFTTGKLTVIVRLVNPVYYKSVSIVLNKYNCTNGKFEYFSDKTFSVDAEWTVIHFDNLEFPSPGLFRIFLLDPNNNTIVSGLIETIEQ